MRFYCVSTTAPMLRSKSMNPNSQSTTKVLLLNVQQNYYD